MYLLDTNIISELRKGEKANSGVTSWAKALSSSALFLSVVTILELEMGVLQKEKHDASQGALLRHWLESHVLPTFVDRILPIDLHVARRCATLHVPNPQSERDALIAATALTHGMTVVTRNVKDFTATGVECLNPWIQS